MNARVLITAQLPGDGPRRLAQVADIQVLEQPSQADLARHLEGCAGLVLTIGERVDAALLDASPELRVVANMGVGYDNVDAAACTAHGVAVANTPGVVTEATADVALMLILAV